MKYLDILYTSVAIIINGIAKQNHTSLQNVTESILYLYAFSHATMKVLISRTID